MRGNYREGGTGGQCDLWQLISAASEATGAKLSLHIFIPRDEGMEDPGYL